MVKSVNTFEVMVKSALDIHPAARSGLGCLVSFKLISSFRNAG